MTLKQALLQAENLLKERADPQAAVLFRQLEDAPGIAPLASFRLGEIYNRSGMALQSLRYHERAFELEPALLSRITPAEHPHHDYVYECVPENLVTACPLCGREGSLHRVFNCATSEYFLRGFAPVRAWMMCRPCHHIYTYSYPENLAALLGATAPARRLEPEPRFYAVIGRAIAEVQQRAPERTLLEVGVGAGEYAAVAAEMGFEVRGIEIRETYADAAAMRFAIPVATTPFLQYPEDRRFGVVTMGDVIEHMDDPLDDVLQKVRRLLVSGGVLHLSTPNFESAYARTLRDDDPMWVVCEHLNYFSLQSMQRLLERNGFTIERYDVSPRYNGSMELIARRES